MVLFDGSDLSKWEADNDKNEATKWVVKNGAMECVPGSGYIRTKDKFGDIQLHVEWAAPTKVEGDSQGRGNSGVFLMGMLEIQVLDNYNNPTYSDGTAGAAYGIMPPLVNALRPPGQFQNYDIIFRRPIYKDGVALDPGYVTVIDHFQGSFPIRRLFSQARSRGCKTLVLEKVSPSGAVADENGSDAAIPGSMNAPMDSVHLMTSSLKQKNEVY